MKHTESQSEAKEKHLFDNPRNVRLVVRGLFACCVLLLLADLVIDRHATHPLEEISGFYGFYGFGACVLLVLVAKEMRKLVMRREDYYDSVDD